MTSFRGAGGLFADEGSPKQGDEIVNGKSEPVCIGDYVCLFFAEEKDQGYVFAYQTRYAMFPI